MRARAGLVLLHGLFLLSAIAGRLGAQEDVFNHPQTEEWNAPQCVCPEAEGGLVDVCGKVWGWRLHKTRIREAQAAFEEPWLEADREKLAQAIHETKPHCVDGAQLLALVGGTTVWRVSRGAELWLYDGKQWSTQSAGSPQSHFDGSAVDLGGGAWLFGTSRGAQILQKGKWRAYELLPETLLRKNGPRMLDAARDQAGQVYAYFPDLGSLWAVDPAGADDFPALREIPVRDTLESAGVWFVYLHPDGTKAKPALVADNMELSEADLKGVQNARPEEFAALLKKLDSDDFEVRKVAQEQLTEDVRARTWRFSSRLLELKGADLSVETLKAIQQVALEHVAAAEPGRCVEFSKLLVQLNLLKADVLKNFDGTYQKLWLLLENSGIWDRVTRVGFQRDQHERGMGAAQIRERFDDPQRFAHSVAGRIDHAYRFSTPEIAAAFNQNNVLEWEEKLDRCLWIGVGNEIWRATNEPDELRGILFPRTCLALDAFLGRDDQGRLLVLGAFKAETTKENEEAQYGIWALSGPKPEKVEQNKK